MKRAMMYVLKKPTRESVILAEICMLDLIFTVFLIQMGFATESNPILRFYLEINLGTFILAKIFLSIGPLVALEVLRSHRPYFVKWIIRAAIVMYILTYILISIHLLVIG